MVGLDAAGKTTILYKLKLGAVFGPERVLTLVHLKQPWNPGKSLYIKVGKNRRTKMKVRLEIN